MIIITGGAGFIGANLIRDWIEHESEPVLNLDKLTYAGNASSLSDLSSVDGYQFVRGDIADTELCQKLLAKYQPRAIINLAAESHVDRSIRGPDAFIETNIVGTFRLLEAVRAYWTDLPASRRQEFRFLHVSTDEVYGSLTPQAPAFTEVSRFEPNSPYSASKAAADHLVRAWYHTYGLPVLTINCANNYGPYQFPEKLIPLCIHNALAGRPLPLYGDGQQIRDWLYVRDHCQGIRLVLAQGRVGETYNIGGGNEKSNISVLHTLCACLDEIAPRSDGKPYSEQIVFVTDRPGHDRRYAIDASKISQELNWRAQTGFQTGMAKTVRWYLDNHVWVENVTSGAYQNWIGKHYAHSTHENTTNG